MSRSDLPRGKGFYIYLFEKYNGSPTELVAEAQALGANWLAPRVVGWNQLDGNTEPYMKEFLQACSSRSIRVGGWGYHVGLNRLNHTIARSEAEAASAAIEKYGLDFYVMNAEVEYKGDFTPGTFWRFRPADAMRLAATTYWQRFRSLQPTICAGMTSYRYPRTHHEMPWDQLLDPRYVDFSQPQVYALGDLRKLGPALQLQACFDQYDELAGDMLPMIPLEAFYAWKSWRQTTAQTHEFAKKARDLELPGYGAYTIEHSTAVQRSAFAESWTPPAETEEPPAGAPFFGLSPDERWGIVETALREHGFVDEAGNVRPDLLGD